MSWQKLFSIFKKGQQTSAESLAVVFPSDQTLNVNAAVSTAAPFELVFYASTTYTIPKNGFYNVHAIGGGGGGAVVTSGNLRRGSGGGAGGYTRKRIYLYANDVLTITVGAGGAYISVTGNGNNGGNTTVVCVARSLSLTANGGSGGTQATTTGTTTGAAGGTASGGDVNYTGGAAGDAIIAGTSARAHSGGGAVNLFGTAYRGGEANSNSSSGAQAYSGGAGVGGNGGAAISSAANITNGGGGGVGGAGFTSTNGQVAYGGVNGDGYPSNFYNLTAKTYSNAWTAKSFFDVSGAGASYDGSSAGYPAGRGGGSCAGVVTSVFPGIFGGWGANTFNTLAYSAASNGGIGGGGGAGETYGGPGGNGVVVVQYEG